MDRLSGQTGWSLQRGVPAGDGLHSDRRFVRDGGAALDRTVDGRLFAHPIKSDFVDGSESFAGSPTDMLQGGEAAESALLLLGALLLMELCIALRAYVAAKQGQWADLVFRESMIDSIIPNFSAHSQLVNAPVRSP